MDGLTFECKMEVISCIAGVVSLRKLHYVLSQLYCVLAWCRKHRSNCSIHGVQRIFEQIRTNPLFACNYKASSLIVLLRFWASFSIKNIHGRLFTNNSSSNVSLKNQHLHLSLFYNIVYAWDQETSWLRYILLLLFFDLAFTGDTRETSQALANGQVSVSLDLLVHKTSKWLF